jgi:hypothetical protein
MVPARWVLASWDLALLIMEEGIAMERVDVRGPVGEKMAVGFEVSGSLEWVLVVLVSWVSFRFWRK